jgi:hypothetical protein
MMDRERDRGGVPIEKVPALSGIEILWSNLLGSGLLPSSTQASRNNPSGNSIACS